MEESRLYLIFEFLSMDLKKYMDTLPQDKLMEPELVRSYLYQISAAMLFCHQRRVLHRDLKPQNLLINRDGVIKVFGYFVQAHHLSFRSWLTFRNCITIRLLILDWVGLLAFRFECTRTKSLLYGTELPRFCSVHSGTLAMWTYGRLDAYSPKWPHGSHCSKAILRLTNFSVCSGKIALQRYVSTDFNWHLYFFC